jgi:hypothetical protein
MRNCVVESTEIDRIRQFADFSIRRACGFGLLAIGTAAMGLVSDMFLVAKLAAICASAMAAILLFKAMQAPNRSYKRTEVWMLLEKRHALPEAHAQQVFAGILRERYLWHATVTATGAGILWLTTVLIALSGRRHGIV